MHDPHEGGGEVGEVTHLSFIHIHLHLKLKKIGLIISILHVLGFFSGNLLLIGDVFM